MIPDIPLPTVVQLTALSFGVFWTALNFYNFFPLAQAGIETLLERARAGDTSPEPIPPEEYPTIDVFVAAYDEAEVIDNALESVCNAVYPSTKLTVYLITEADDEATRRAAHAHTDCEFESIVVPEEYPGEPNKPRALNYAFEQSSGDVIGVIDAEDIVDRRLFDEVAQAVVRDGAEYMQGRPDMVNEGDGWLNLLFRAEYGYWYNLVVPARTTVDYPVPLSGNTCFFTRERLEQLSRERLARQEDAWDAADYDWAHDHGLAGFRPWDPENVTEDFEIGLRLWATDTPFSYLSAVTKEESPLSLNEWIQQRTRWKKGKIYTGRRFFEQPPAGIRNRLHLYWQSLLPHLGPINVAGIVIVLMIANLITYRPGPIIASVLSLGIAFAVIVSTLFATGYYVTSEYSRSQRLRRALVVGCSVWLYWFLQWGADIRALVQAYIGDFSWEHTDHLGRNTNSTQAVPTGERLVDEITIRAPRRQVLLTAITILGLLPRLYRLGSWSLWVDEIYTVSRRSALPVRELLLLPTDPHPPLYYLLMHGWMETVGQTTALVRLPSVAFSVATIPAVYALGRRVYTDRVGLIAAAFVAISPFHIHFARVARMYALFGLLTVISWYFFFSLSTSSRRAVVGYVLATTALVYVHVFAAFIVLAQLLVYFVQTPPRPFASKAMARAISGAGILSLPWIGVLSVRVWGLLTADGSTRIDWIPEPSSVAIARTVVSFAGFPDYYPIRGDSLLPYLIASLLVFIYAGLLLASVLEYQDPEGYDINATWYTGGFAAWLSIPILLPFVISQVLPIYAPRYTLPASLPLFVLAARGLTALHDINIRRLLFMLIILGSAINTGIYLTTDSAEPWNQAAERIELQSTPQDLLVLQPGYIEASLTYYYDGPSLDTVTLRQAEAVSASEYRILESQLSSHDRVWLVTYFESSERTRTTISQTHTRVQQYSLGAVTVTLYERSTQADTTNTTESQRGLDSIDAASRSLCGCEFGLI